MTSATTPKTVELYGYGTQAEATVTNAAVTPGMLVVRTDTGVRPHNVAGGIASPSFAQENGAVGRGIDDAYAIGDQCIFKTYSPGAGIYALLAAGSETGVNTELASAGNGALAEATTDVIAVAVSLEAVDNTGGSSPVRIRVELISPQRTAAA